MPYVFRAIKDKTAPLLIILHGRSNNKEVGKFTSQTYNVLLPLDLYGYQGTGSWFLGEHGDFFVLDMYLDLVRRIREENGLTGPIYIWGSSMGGFAAILTGLMLGAKAVFAHIPQTNLMTSNWYKANRRVVDFIFGGAKGHPYRNLPAYIINHDKLFPLFFLSFNRFDARKYNLENCSPLINALDQRNLNYFLLIHPQAGHALHQKCAEQIVYFDTYKAEIDSNWQRQIHIAKRKLKAGNNRA